MTDTKPLPPSLARKLAEASLECGYVQKDKRNKQGEGYTYASSEAVLDKVGPALSKRGIATLPRPRVIERYTIPTRSGGEMRAVDVEVTYTLIDSETGESYEIVGLGSGMDSGDKALMKAQTVAAKYAWTLLLKIATGDDPEADEKADAETRDVPAQQQRAQSAPAAYFELRGGKHKGMRTDDPALPLGYLRWLFEQREAEAVDPAKERWRERNLEQCAILKAEIDRREGPKAPPDGLEIPPTDDIPF